MMRPRVVITGRDVASPLGITWQETAEALLQGRSGIQRIRAFDASALPTSVAGQVRGLASASRSRTRIQALLDRVCARAVEESGLDCPLTRTAVALAVGKHPVDITHRGGQPDPQWDGARDYQGQAARIATEFHCTGQAYTCYTACASGNDAIGLAVALLRRNDVDAVICAGADSQIAPVALLEFDALNVLAPAVEGSEPQPRPFDRRRNGFVVGEGAAAFVLERLEHARRRGASIHGEILGYGSAADAHSLTGDLNGCGAARAMQAALNDAKVESGDIDYINAHGTATIKNDLMESRAINDVFGRGRPPVSSTKSMTGHLLAAGAAVELAFCMMAIEGAFLPPTINCYAPDPLCELDCVPHRARSARVRKVLSNAFGLGGQNACVVVSGFDE